VRKIQVYNAIYVMQRAVIHVRFQVLTAASMKFRVFWGVLPHSQVDVEVSIYLTMWQYIPKTLNFSNNTCFVKRVMLLNVTFNK
jgi:hypothetical protein